MTRSKRIAATSEPYRSDDLRDVAISIDYPTMKVRSLRDLFVLRDAFDDGIVVARLASLTGDSDSVNESSGQEGRMRRTTKGRVRGSRPHQIQPSVPLPTPAREIVHGLRLHVSGKELAVRLGERIRWHRQRGDVLIDQLKKLDTLEREAADELAKALTGYASPRTLMEKQLREHQERAVFLAFLHDHLSPDDVYRLDSSDLRMTEILPEKPW